MQAASGASVCSLIQTASCIWAGVSTGLGIEQVEHRAGGLHLRLVDHPQDHALHLLRPEGDDHQAAGSGLADQLGGEVVVEEAQRLGDVDGDFDVAGIPGIDGSVWLECGHGYLPVSKARSDAFRNGHNIRDHAVVFKRKPFSCPAKA